MAFLMWLGRGRTAETPLLHMNSSVRLSPPFCENFEIAAGQQTRIFSTWERNFLSISFLSSAFRHRNHLLHELCFICLTTDICACGIVLPVQKGKGLLQIRSHMCSFHVVVSDTLESFKYLSNWTALIKSRHELAAELLLWEHE